MEQVLCGIESSYRILKINQIQVNNLSTDVYNFRGINEGSIIRSNES